MTGALLPLRSRDAAGAASWCGAAVLKLPSDPLGGDRSCAT